MVTITTHGELSRIYVPKGVLVLSKTFDCGQCFRWYKVNHEHYAGIVAGKMIFIRYLSDESNDINDCFATNLVGDDVRWLVNYLGLNDNYCLDSINFNEFEKRAINYGQGIRILHQDTWETVVSFIISQRNNIPKIKKTIERMCMYFGEHKTEVIYNRPYGYFAFPTIDSILKASDRELKECGLGYRVDYIKKAAEAFKSGYFDNINMLNSMTTAELLNYVEKLYGVGPKVANCIVLFGFNRLDAFPIDVWMQRVIDNYYGGSIDVKRFGSLAGLIQQYLFYYIKFNEQEM